MIRVDAAIVAITGVGGVGKSALAVQWAHRNAHRYPDGQIYLDLRGFTPASTPATASETLARLLHAFGFRQDSLDRLISHHLHTAYSCDQLLAPHRAPLVMDPPETGAVILAFTDDQWALEWLTAQHSAIRASQLLALHRERHRSALQLAWALDNVHYRRGMVRDHVDTWCIALEAAQRTTDSRSTVLAHRRLGAVTTRVGKPDDATRLLKQALVLARAQHDSASDEADIEMDLAVAQGKNGQHAVAVAHARRAAQLYRQAGQPLAEADAINNVGWYTSRCGRVDEARQYCAQAAAMHRDHGNAEGLANALDSLGHIELAAHRPFRATAHFTEAMKLFHGLGHAFHEAETSNALGDALSKCGQTTEALAAWRLALDRFTEPSRAAAAAGVRSKIAANS